nr:MAG TPA: hypothetical protein [Caudoviricetes sp.]
MAQNVTIAGVSFENVPSVDIAKTGGGFARFVDSSDANAAASDIAKNKTAYVNGIKLVGTLESGGKSANVQQNVIQPNFLASGGFDVGDPYVALNLSNYLSTDNRFVLFVTGTGKIIEPETGLQKTEEEGDFFMSLWYISNIPEENFMDYFYQNSPSFIGVGDLSADKVITVPGMQGNQFKDVGMVYEVSQINSSALVSWQE